MRLLLHTRLSWVIPSNSGLIFPLHIHYNAIQCQIMPLSKHKYIALIQQPGQEIIFYTPPDCVTMTSQSKSALRKTNTFGYQSKIIWLHPIIPVHIVVMASPLTLIVIASIKFPLLASHVCINILFIYPEMIFSVLHKIFVISVQCSNGPQ